MIISKTPFRISFFGGGTDYPAWFRKEGGAVLCTSIDRYCYITVRFLPPFFRDRHRIVWSHIELPNTISEILHPAIREGLRFLKFDDSCGYEIHHQGDLPARAGMGSSSAFAVGLIKALLALRGESIDRHTLACKAIELEQQVLRENVGCQDQVSVAYGGLNRIEFFPDGSFDVSPVAAPAERVRQLESSLMLFYTGVGRLASEVAASIIANVAKKEETLRRMRRMVDEGQAILEKSGDLDAFGHLLDEAWIHKRALSEIVSNNVIDEIYETARKAGALGGKLLGAGSSGFMVFYVPIESQGAVRKALRHLLHVPFRFELLGSHIINSNST